MNMNKTSTVLDVPVYSKPEWNDVKCSESSSISVGIIGDSIVLIRASGIMGISAIQNLIGFVDPLITEQFSDGREYVRIEDFSDLQGVSLEARKYFIQSIKNNQQLKSFIFCNVSSMFELSIKLARKLNIVGFDIHVVSDYSKAFALAEDILSKPNVKVPLNSNALSASNTEPHDESDICPYSNLVVTGKPEWTDIDLGEGYSVTFKFIGNRILLTIPKGNAGENGMEKLFMKRASILDSVLQPNETFYEIRDYSYCRLRITETEKAQFRAGMGEYQGRFMGFTGVCLPLLARVYRNVGLKRLKLPYPRSMVRTYQAAIKKTIQETSRGDMPASVPSRQVTRQADWQLRIDGFSVTFEIIDGFILHADMKGRMEESHLTPLFEMYQRVVDSNLLPKYVFCFVVGVPHLLGSRKARQRYFDEMMRYHRINPFKMVIFYGANRFLNSDIVSASYFAPFPVHIMENLGLALRYIDGTNSIEQINQSIEKTPNKDSAAMIYQYVDDLLRFLGNINWETDGCERVEEESSHPFKSVFDAINLIKTDFDVLSQEREQSGAALSESELKYRTLIENSTQAIAVIQDQKLSFVNPKMERIFGRSAEDLHAQPFIDFIHKDDRTKILERYEQRTRGEIVEGPSLYRIIQKSGMVRFVEITASPFSWDHQPALLIFLVDITEQKTVEEDLRHYRENLEQLVKERTTDLEIANEELQMEIGERKQIEAELTQTMNFLESIFNSSMEGITSIDLDGTIIYTSPRSKDILDYEGDDIIGKKLHSFFENGEAEFNSIMRELSPNGELRDYELKRIRKNGEVAIISLSAALQKDDKGNTIGTTGIYRDITEKKKMAEVLEQAKLEAEAGSKSKGEFLANMSHEIRTPLNGIIGMSEIALDSVLDDEHRDVLQTINSEADSLLNIINDVLDFSKIESGKLELEAIPFDLAKTFNTIVQSFSHRAELKKLSLKSFLAPEIPPRLVGDPGRLRQILVNLVGNALKFTHTGQIFIKGELAENAGERIKIRFSVQDTGIGIPENIQKTIFESFTQADGSTTRNYGGTGLGTTISKQLVELMGGEIHIESCEGKGSTFWFTVRFEKHNGPEPMTVTDEISLDNKRILSIACLPASGDVLREYLTALKCQFVEVVKSEEVIPILKDSIAAKDPFDLILIDFQIPETGTSELISSIREIEYPSTIPIIILTTVGRRGDGMFCRKMGISGYLSKPFNLDELRDVIETVLDFSKKSEIGKTPQLITRYSIADDKPVGVRILLVEDYPTNQQVAMRYLTQAGHQVELAKNGREAVVAYQNNTYDIILMDIQMPVMDGYEATAEIRTLEKTRTQKIPIVATTAHAIKGYSEKCLEAGMDDYISKPLAKRELLAIVAKWTNSIPVSDVGKQINPQTDSLASAPTISGVEADEPAPMNYQQAINEFEGDEEFLKEVLEGFITHLKSQILTIEDAWRNGDVETLKNEAHAIKGGALNLTASDLAATALEIELIGQSKTIDQDFKVIENLKKETNRLESYCRHLTHG